VVSARWAQNLAEPWFGGAARGSEVGPGGTGESEDLMALWGRGGREDRGGGHSMPRMTRKERRALRRRAAEDAELAARVQRAQRRLAQATGPLPVIDPRRAPDALGAPARRSAIVD
jgi:hypothetical protein